ncbi:Protein IQ-DOMAIN 1 [Quillaja saponaria]|uniref:Protein IQ-DOMAIN 1 n=1 Tax=Quillaja saponaria TaxID=32244 RepID=A0AAD7PRU2_QUISA|nr:Protein IQ-DOMAIN 1 [Quillaja saponaria]
MGITGELVRTVFSRNRSVGTVESNGRSNVVEKRRWISVRSYLCGDEFNSVLAEEDSSSVKSSEATVTQPVHEDLTDNGGIQSEETMEIIPEKNLYANSKTLHEEEAAIIIQSAFRGFLSRRQTEGIKLKNSEQELNLVTGSPDRESMGTSIEVQTGNSTDFFSSEGERLGVQSGIRQKTRTQATKLKQDWDDSTVSSNVSKMRMQKRLEATTRRERALAYAFSQQLRICSKKKPNKSNGKELNIGWSWLERWMATRLPEASSAESHASQQHEQFESDNRFMIRKRFLDATREEKESCGSNEGPVQFDNFSLNSPEGKDGFRTKNNLEARRCLSRRKTVPSYQFTEEYSTVREEDGSTEGGKVIT